MESHAWNASLIFDYIRTYGRSRSPRHNYPIIRLWDAAHLRAGNPAIPCPTSHDAQTHGSASERYHIGGIAETALEDNP
jgi:hypothetical protein